MRNAVYFAFILVFLITNASLATVYIDQNAPGPVHDGTSWDTAFLKIQDGVNAATSGSEVWVADGTYVENIVMGEGVQLYGGFLGAQPDGYETDLSERDFVNHVATIDGNKAGSCMAMAVNAIVDGFTVRNGSGSFVDGVRRGGGFNCNGLGNDIQQSTAIRNNVITGNSGSHGGAIHCCGSSPTIMNNTITGNSSAHGGAVYCDSSSPAITNNIMTNNSADNADGGGAVFCSYASPTIANNTIIGNSPDGIRCWESSPTIANNTISGTAGIGIHCGHSSPMITNNTITGNADSGIFCHTSSPTIMNNTIVDNIASNGGAISCWYFSAPTITNNAISGNSATHGGAIACWYISSPTIADNTISGNSASLGGAIHCYTSSPAIMNNTIVGNSAVHDGGAIYCNRPSAPMISNNIIVSNIATSDGGGIWCHAESLPALTANDFWGNVPDDYSGCDPGVGDISEDPLLVDPDGPDGDPTTWEDNDYHLQSASLCIDKGNNTAPGLPYQDYEGDPRVCDGDGDGIAIVDIGADEYRTTTELTTAPSEWFVPGWVWFSIPLHPQGSEDAADILGYNLANRVFAWDDVRKNINLYPDDFTDLAVGPSYLTRLNLGEEDNPIYEGTQPQLPFEWLLPAAGWCWVGVPGTQDILGGDLRVEKDGVVRTVAEDKTASDPWLNWNWIFWDPVRRTAKIMNPVSGGDDTWLHPWCGYRVWANTPDVTIIFP